MFNTLDESKTILNKELEAYKLKAEAVKFYLDNIDNYKRASFDGWLSNYFEKIAPDTGKTYTEYSTNKTKNIKRYEFKPKNDFVTKLIVYINCRDNELISNYITFDIHTKYFSYDEKEKENELTTLDKITLQAKIDLNYYMERQKTIKQILKTIDKDYKEFKAKVKNFAKYVNKFDYSFRESINFKLNKIH